VIGIALLVVAAVAIVVAVILLIIVIRQRILINGLQIAVVALGVGHIYAVVLYCRQLIEFLIDAGLCAHDNYTSLPTVFFTLRRLAVTTSTL